MISSYNHIIHCQYGLSTHLNPSNLFENEYRGYSNIKLAEQLTSFEKFAYNKYLDDPSYISFLFGIPYNYEADIINSYYAITAAYQIM